MPVLARKPGALRNGAPFMDWGCRARWGRCGASSTASTDGDRQMVDILTAVLTDGLAAVEAACAEALAAGIASADVILNILARQQRACATGAIHDAGAPAAAGMPPLADCARYDSLRSRADAEVAMERHEILEMMGDAAALRHAGGL